MNVVSKPGVRLQSAVSEVQVVVVRPTAVNIELACGGAPMIGVDEPAPAGGAIRPSDEAVQLGKRYFDEQTGLEVLCSKGGAGPLTVDGRPLQVRGAKALPSSD